MQVKRLEQNITEYILFHIMGNKVASQLHY